MALEGAFYWYLMDVFDPKMKRNHADVGGSFQNSDYFSENWYEQRVFLPNFKFLLQDLPLYWV